MSQAAAVPPHLTKKTVPERIRWLRKQAGSHDKLAGHIGTTRQVVIRWEQGKSKPSLESRKRLADYSGLPLSAFRNGDGDEDEDESEQAIVDALLQVVRLLRRDQRDEVAA